MPLLRATTRLRYQRYIRLSIEGNEHHTELFNSYNLKKTSTNQITEDFGRLAINFF